MVEPTVVAALSHLRIVALLLVAMSTVGCVGLTPAVVPSANLDVGTGNAWTRDVANSTGVEGGFFTKQAVNAYEHDPVGDDSYPGTLRVLSIATLLSPDRGELLDQLEKQLIEQTEEQGLDLDYRLMEGERQLGSGAQSLFIAFNATAREDGVFASDATVKVIGEVFRCTGGPTVIATGTAQVESTRAIGGITTEHRYDPGTWEDIVMDPQGSIEGFRGQEGLIYNIRCP